MSRSAMDAPARPGTGARCPQAQADGVPCDEIRDCEICRPDPMTARHAGDTREPALIVPRCTHA